MEKKSYASREGNHLPVIDFNGAPDTVGLVEGEFFSATISATDADGDPVVLSRTPMENTTFDPARGIFTFRPDALQITEGDGHYESDTFENQYGLDPLTPDGNRVFRCRRSGRPPGNSG